MQNLTELNIKLNKMTANKKLVDSTRATIVNDIIALIIEEAKEGHYTFTNKRMAQKWIIVQLLDDENKNLDAYTKRAIGVAKKLLVDGYQIKKEALTLAQAENLLKADKKHVNGLMKHDAEDADEDGETEYSREAKALIKATQTTEALKAIEKAGLSDALKALKKAHGTDTKKVLNMMIKAL